MLRKILVLCLITALILVLAITASANDFDPDKTGMISVTLAEQYEKTPIAGAQLSLYHIATVGTNNSGNLTYSFTPDFARVSASTDDSDLAEKLEAFISENEITATRLLTDSQGNATFSNLPLGLYFVLQTNTVEGFAPCTPFLVTLPTVDNGEYSYEVNASPKTEVAKLTSVTIKKVWNIDETATPPESVTIQLLRNNKVVKTAILNAENNWQITYNDLPESDSYTVKELNVPKGFVATYDQNGYIFTVTNTSTLVQTGQLVWPIPLLGFAGILLIWLGVALLKKRKNNA